MTIPILGQASSTKCVVCGGFLTPDHRHVYIDVDTLAFYDRVIEAMLTNRCLLVDPENGDIYYGHPKLKETHVWAPVKVTHTGPHDECGIRIPHHHCEFDTFVS
jgi:hypothetical protein